MTSDRRIAAALFVLAFVTYAWFFNGGGWNQNAQFDLTRALVERQTLHIDAYKANTGDTSEVGSHVYINKPPGVSFLAAIPYAPLYAIERALDVPVDSWKWLTINLWIVTALTCGVTGALIPVVIYLYGRRRIGASQLASIAIALAVAFGTITFPFATMLFAHVPAALFLLLAFYWLDERPLLAGVMAGISSLCFYICIPAAGVMFLGARRRWRFLLGGVPFGIILAIYHYLCFGSPFRTAVETSTAFTEKGLLFGVFRLPLRKALWGLTAGDYRGLFFFSPFLVLAIAGAIVMLQRRVMRRELAMIAAISAIFILSIASFNGWHGGGSYGPRYILPMIPLFALPLFFLRGRLFAGLGVFLALISFGIQLVGTATHPMPHGSIGDPVQGWAVPKFWEGEISGNEQTVDELVPRFLYRKGTHQNVWASFNVGEFVFGPSTRMSVLPIVLWVLLGSALLAQLSRVRPGNST